MDAGHIMLPVGQQVSLSGHFDVTVVLEAARPLAKGFECRVHLHQSTCDKPPCGETAGYCPGDPKERQHWPAPRAQGIEWNKSVISLEEANALVMVMPTGDDKVPLANADQRCLLVEPANIRLTCSYDRHFTGSMSGIRTLPHQIEAVSTVN